MEHKSILIINGIGNKPVLNFKYEIVQPVKENGHPSACPIGGLIHFTIASLNNDELFFHEWMISKTDIKDGKFYFEVMHGAKLSQKTISFKNAYCVRLHEYFTKDNDNQMQMDITISVAEIAFGENENVVFKNDRK